MNPLLQSAMDAIDVDLAAHRHQIELLEGAKAALMPLLAGSTASNDVRPHPARLPQRSPREVVGGTLKERILHELDRRSGPMTPGELTHAVGAGALVVRNCVDDLEAEGKVHRTGVTTGRVIRLGPAPSASVAAVTPRSAEKPPAATEKAPPPVSTAASGELAVVTARDHAVLERLQQGEATLEQILASMPAEPGLSEDERRTACRRAIKRLALKRTIFDVGEKWRLA